MVAEKVVLVTGGAGYIGSHCIVELLNANYTVIAVDNFVNSAENGEKSIALQRVEKITGKKVYFYRLDLLQDKNLLNDIFQKHKIDFCVHFAALKAVGESMMYPLLYYKNNLISMINLLDVMKLNNCYQLVFSSSCTVYGEPKQLPIKEETPIGSNITNVYGKTKCFNEDMLMDIAKADKKWNIISLRYFNPVGAHPSGLIGEDPKKEFSNIMPYISQVAFGNKPHVNIFGGDYSTPDGTGVRDYIHVMDLASGHVAAIRKLQDTHLNYKVYNLGTGKGVSVLELIKTFEEVTGRQIPYMIKDRREGDIVCMYADCTLAENELKWKAKHNLQQMCAHFWNWQINNPKGYRTET